MPKTTNVRLTSPDATPTPKASVTALPVNTRPLYPWANPDVSEPTVHAPLYAGDLNAGDGADRSYKPNPLGSYSNNVPQPDNKGPVRSGGDGMDGMAG